ncbi:YggS family pyridoxal phosphate-dependent enzyme [Pseudofulvibacter geojedonensis]|uniref:Pyridoxal phosphate homeostasis protein n=1 Tax=Pseudofulvibacter geojedonensis TaxID=1123758 RepID=A0ABW3HZ00_9FLAO
MSIAQNLQQIKSEIPENVTLVAVSKTKPVEDILEAYNAGQRIFGENRVQEMTQKWQELPKDIEWHMIGNLQRNNVKYMAEYVSLIHGVDSFKLLKEINKQAEKHSRVINCLLQIKIAQENTKAGMTPEEAYQLLHSKETASLKNINITGLMGMATFTDDQKQVDEEFKLLKSTFNKLKNYTTLNFNPTTISMGMSGDYQLAIENGSNMIRVGSSIFGSRNYNI